MILVNFVGQLDAFPSTLKHNDDYLSYADTILPGFLFIVGISFRLTMIRRSWQVIWTDTCVRYVGRSLILIFISILIFGFPENCCTWSQWAENWDVLLARFLKSDLWETLAIIGVTQLVILPLVPISAGKRMAALFAFACGHALLCYWFNWGFVMGYLDNWMVEIWGTGTYPSWDGGCFGPLCWAVPMLAGTLAYDIIADGESHRNVISRLIFFGAALSIMGYCLSCLTRLYDLEDAQSAPMAQSSDIRNADSPFIPSLASLGHRSPLSLLAELPFVAPPPGNIRLQNYWMMSKKIPTLSFILCSTGLILLFYVAFVWLCDNRRLQLGIFRTFGTNPLLAYCINEVLQPRIQSFLPTHASLWFCLMGFAIHFVVIYGCVRYLERQKLFVRV
jgi:predicted acyltransferase